MAARSITSLYTILVDRAEATLTRPGAGDEQELADLIEEIEIAVRKSAEGERLIGDEEKLLSRCMLRIHQARREGNAERVRTWSQLAGVLLPLAREHFSKAIAAGRRNAVSTTDQDYRRR